MTGVRLIGVTVEVVAQRKAVGERHVIRRRVRELRERRVAAHARTPAEHLVERAVLLHDEHDVADGVFAQQRRQRHGRPELGYCVPPA